MLQDAVNRVRILNSVCTKRRSTLVPEVSGPLYYKYGFLNLKELSLFLVTLLVFLRRMSDNIRDIAPIKSTHTHTHTHIHIYIYTIIHTFSSIKTVRLKTD